MSRIGRELPAIEVVPDPEHEPVPTAPAAEPAADPAPAPVPSPAREPVPA